MFSHVTVLTIKQVKWVHEYQKVCEESIKKKCYYDMVFKTSAYNSGSFEGNTPLRLLVGP